jgi:hypothetical protein
MGQKWKAHSLARKPESWKKSRNAQLNRGVGGAGQRFALEGQ